MELAAKDRDWVFGFEDETWWSRLEQPQMYSWSTQQDNRPLCLVNKELAKRRYRTQGVVLLWSFAYGYPEHVDSFC
jgi:hypothetical protein